ncbi:MAG TPA: phosphate ABC transporter permease subunit PstC, partial [Candidatus Baltobacteraceae bacterium]|nr:phosphate ABC transporter permease subunit PstC [Candidatus Baltobacteraceae bacterium]
WFLKSASAFFVLTIALLLGYLAFEGTKLFWGDHKSVFEFLFSARFDPEAGYVGAAPFIIGSLFVTAFAIVVGGPFGVAVGVFFAELAPKRVAAAMKPAIEVLVGIPSVVYGWLGLTLLVPLIRNTTGGSGFGLLAAGIVLSLMILPTVVSLSEDALKVVPDALREGSFALGATRWETISKVLLPAAKSGLAVAVILGIARAIGETLAIQLVIGNAPVIPTSLLSSASALTSQIVMDMGGAAQGSLLQHTLFAMAFLLLLIAMGLIVIIKLAIRKPS